MSETTTTTVTPITDALETAYWDSDMNVRDVFAEMAGLEAELAKEKTRLDWLERHVLAQHSEYVSIAKLGRHYNGFPGSFRAAIDRSIEEGAP